MYKILGKTELLVQSLRSKKHILGIEAGELFTRMIMSEDPVIYLRYIKKILEDYSKVSFC